MRKHWRLAILGLLIGAAFAAAMFYMLRPATRDLAEIRTRVLPKLAAALEEKGLRLGAPIFIRIFKQSDELELWVEDGDRFSLFRTYAICNYSGKLGPKLREGDRQAPEGFYEVSRRLLNPESRYHLSFNLGFPNAYDQAHGRTGSFLMVHGKCRSIGCYAMTDAGIEEIYLLAEAALGGGQPFFHVHAFPFRMDETAPQQDSDTRWQAFWNNLAEGYRYFEEYRRPPDISVEQGRYVIARGEV